MLCTFPAANRQGVLYAFNPRGKESSANKKEKKKD